MEINENLKLSSKLILISLIILYFLFYSSILCAIDRVATFPVIEKVSSDNGLAVNPIIKGSSRGSGSISNSNTSLTFKSSSSVTSRSYLASGTTFRIAYDTNYENGYVGGSFADGKSIVDYSYNYDGYKYAFEYQTKLTTLLLNGASELSNDLWLGGYVGYTSSKEDDSLRVSTYNYSSTATNSVLQMGVFGSTSIASEIRFGWRVSPASSSKANYSGNLWSSTTNTRMGNGLTLNAGIGIQEKLYSTEFVYYTQSEEKDAGQGNQSGYVGIYERDLGEFGIGLNYAQISSSELKIGDLTSLGYEQTQIKLEGVIKIDESFNGRVQFQKHDTKIKNSIVTDKSEFTALDFIISRSF